jgi:hypothetical protein
MCYVLLISVFEYTEQGADYAVLNFRVICLGSLSLAKYYSDDQIEKYEMGGHVARMGGEKMCIQGFDEET